ncbi:MAG: nucleoside monophosphate kinase [Candidatus Woesearchaeota archaeon]|nr:nucleoside monophosphate kinase [Candidatus Woesearchaeota archaeon]
MIITISGTAGSGKSTVAKAVAKEFRLKHYSAGDFMRELAAERDISLEELSRLAEKDISIDREIDERTKKLAKRDNFVIDSRLAFHFLPKAIKIFLKVSPGIAAKRIWRDIKAKKRAVEQFSSEKEVLSGILKRQDSEVKRYKKYYSLDYLDEQNYDFVLDTSKLNIEESIEETLNFIRKKII